MKKVTNGRNYYHKPIEILEGTSIMIYCGSPRRAGMNKTIPYEVVDGQITNRVKYIPFEHKPVSGTKAKENFLKSLDKHKKKVEKELESYLGAIPLNKFTKTSKIIKLN